MPVSRLRIRLAAAFALVLAVLLGLIIIADVWHHWHESNKRLDERLFALTTAVDDALRHEIDDDSTASLERSAQGVVRRWPHRSNGFAILDATGRSLAVRDPRGLAGPALAAMRADVPDRLDFGRDGHDARAVRRRIQLARGGAEIVVFDSTEDIERDAEALTVVLLIAVPFVVLLAAAGGYVLSGWALRPIDRLGDAIDAIPPDDLAARLALPPERDEVSALAERVNTLLARVEAARLRHQRFVREAAHQIRTPLTLVLGEAEEALVPARLTSTDPERSLRRIHLAAEQMRRRVDELLLFAEADSGTAFDRTDDVELDALAFECTDLMRRRADSLGRQLALSDLAPVTIRANEALLREALLEMLENAVRHGGASTPVEVEVELQHDMASLIVRSALSDADDRPATGTGLGRRVLDWIAAGHGGRAERLVVDGRYEARLILPIDG